MSVEAQKFTYACLKTRAASCLCTISSAMVKKQTDIFTPNATIPALLDIYFYHLILLVAKPFYATDRNVAN